jgi:hypothetical protein
MYLPNPWTEYSPGKHRKVCCHSNYRVPINLVLIPIGHVHLYAWALLNATYLDEPQANSQGKHLK